MLGSILLPSYKVSEVLPSDRNYRRFAFKCEHKNMRTYALASENGEYMRKWMRVLIAATMMQTLDDPPSAQGPAPLVYSKSDSAIAMKSARVEAAANTLQKTTTVTTSSAVTSVDDSLQSEGKCFVIVDTDG